MIQLSEVSKIYVRPDGTEVNALSRVSFSIEPGELFALIGPSGCGKTTCLKIMNALTRPSSGEVFIDGQSIRAFQPTTLRRNIGYVLQGGGLFPHLRVWENISIMGKLSSWSKERRLARSSELLELVGLNAKEHANSYPRQLSGGQQQRVGIARSLCLDPQYIFMDEPFSALDPITRRELQEEFSNLRHELGKTIVLITHDMDEAVRLADRIVVLEKGEVIQLGSPKDILSTPATPFVEQLLEGYVQ